MTLAVTDPMTPPTKLHLPAPADTDPPTVSNPEDRVHRRIDVGATFGGQAITVEEPRNKIVAVWARRTSATK
jgi:hypothetical protein